MTREETPQQRKAYDFYCQLRVTGLSVDDSLTEVIKECKVTKRTAYRWKKAFNWDDRVFLRQKQIRKEVEEVTDTTLVDVKARLANIVNAPLDDYQSKVEDGELPVQVKSSADLDRLVKLLLLIYGEATDRTESKEEHDVIITDPRIAADIAELGRQLHIQKE